MLSSKKGDYHRRGFFFQVQSLQKILYITSEPVLYLDYWYIAETTKFNLSCFLDFHCTSMNDQHYQHCNNLMNPNENIRRAEIMRAQNNKIEGLHSKHTIYLPASGLSRYKSTNSVEQQMKDTGREGSDDNITEYLKTNQQIVCKQIYI